MGEIGLLLTLIKEAPIVAKYIAGLIDGSGVDDDAHAKVKAELTAAGAFNESAEAAARIRAAQDPSKL